MTNIFYFFSIYTPVFFHCTLMVSTVILFERIIIYLLQILQNAGIFQDFFCYVEPTQTLERVFKVMETKDIQNFHYYHLLFSFLSKLPNSALEQLSSNHCRSLLIRPKFNKCFFTPATLKIYCQYILMLPVSSQFIFQQLVQH